MLHRCRERGQGPLVVAPATETRLKSGFLRAPPMQLLAHLTAPMRERFDSVALAGSCCLSSALCKGPEEALHAGGLGVDSQDRGS
jgi:hypothetical protein